MISALDQLATPAAMPESGKIVLLRGTECTNCSMLSAASLAQLVARRSHNPKVVSSILTGSIFVMPVEYHSGQADCALVPIICFPHSTVVWSSGMIPA